jgi:multiple RNA-binding domain-containing protein 1
MFVSCVQSLAYRRYQSVPLYLEWAPAAALRLPQKGSAQVPNLKGNVASTNVQDADAEDITTATRTLFVKNLCFSTSEETIRSVFERAGRVRSVKMPKKHDGGKKGGFCFVEFTEARMVESALKDMQGVVVDGRALEVQRQEARSAPLIASSSKKKQAKTTATRTKVVVRNVAFQASAVELRELFANFGSLKSVRMPKKMDGQHRGFAFIDFQSAHEAEEAMNRLKNTHLYGRHLVIEWVEDGDDRDQVSDLRISATKDLQSSQQGSKKRKKETRDGSLQEILDDISDDEE